MWPHTPREASRTSVQEYRNTASLHNSRIYGRLFLTTELIQWLTLLTFWGRWETNVVSAQWHWVRAIAAFWSIFNETNNLACLEQLAIIKWQLITRPSLNFGMNKYLCHFVLHRIISGTKGWQVKVWGSKIRKLMGHIAEAWSSSWNTFI